MVIFTKMLKNITIVQDSKLRGYVCCLWLPIDNSEHAQTDH